MYRKQFHTVTLEYSYCCMLLWTYIHTQFEATNTNLTLIETHQVQHRGRMKGREHLWLGREEAACQGKQKKLSNRTKCIIWGQYLPEHMLSLLSCLTPWLSTLPTAEWVMGTHTAFIFSTLGYNDLSSCPSLLWLANQSTYLFSCRSGIRDAMAGQSKQTARKVRARQITIVCREIIKIFLFSL